MQCPGEICRSLLLPKNDFVVETDSIFYGIIVYRIDSLAARPRFINFSIEKFILIEDEDLMNCVTETVTKMIEALPEPLQKKVLEEITPIISEALDEAKWAAQFERGNSKLVKIAEEVKDLISKGGTEPMDFSKL